MIQELTLRGILSFGPNSPPLEMRPLNVLIGPNGSGKSNLLEAIGLLRSAPNRLAEPIEGADGSGVAEWIWKGSPSGLAQVDVVIDNVPGKEALRHVFEFADTAARFDLRREVIEYAKPGLGHSGAYWFYQYQNGRALLRVKDDNDPTKQRTIPLADIAHDESILSQRKDPDAYPTLGHLADVYSKIRLFREWSFGRTAVFRKPQSSSLRGDQLQENFSNLGRFLNRLRKVPRVKNAIIEHLRDLYAGLDDFDVSIKEGGTVEVFLTEGDFVIPGSRLSDGTLRYLCLLAILCDPDPPPLICIEEPELGLHPDTLPKLADLLVAASERTQLIVTTHSDILVDAMTERPESVVVVEKHDGQTVMKRLEANDMAIWLEKYRLGELWISGQIGGTRW